jgi:hypothetical protein
VSLPVQQARNASEEVIMNGIADLFSTLLRSFVGSNGNDINDLFYVLVRISKMI